MRDVSVLRVIVFFTKYTYALYSLISLVSRHNVNHVFAFPQFSHSTVYCKREGPEEWLICGIRVVT